MVLLKRNAASSNSDDLRFVFFQFIFVNLNVCILFGIDSQPYCSCRANFLQSIMLYRNDPKYEFPNWKLNVNGLSNRIYY